MTKLSTIQMEIQDVQTLSQRTMHFSLQWVNAERISAQTQSEQDEF